MLDGQRLPTQLETKIAIRNKNHRKSSLLKQNNKEEKEILPLLWHILALSDYYKRNFNEKVESDSKPAATLPNF